jgi:hypothetical protein
MRLTAKEMGMTKGLGRLVVGVLAVLLLFGCGKKSGLEGKIVDGNGQPLANVTIVATQVQPIKGYERFETTSSADGIFRFGGLFPSSEYVLFPWAESWGSAPLVSIKYDPANLETRFSRSGWTTERRLTLQSGPEGQTLVLPAPISVQQAISMVEGKIVDVRDQPLGNVKIIATQVRPIKGYEQFETTTAADGVFTFNQLFPDAEYRLHVQGGGEVILQEVKAQTAHEGQRVLLPSLRLQFISSTEGIITDTLTGLMWAPAPDREVTWDQANAYAQNLKLGGYTDWRLPTRSELRSLYDASEEDDPSSVSTFNPILRLTACCPWSSEVEGSDRAWSFHFGPVKLGFSHHSRSNSNRVLAVRSPE